MREGMTMDKENILFQGEMQLTAWGDSSTTGAWVKFWIDPEDLEHFKLLRARKGNKEAGTRLAVVMVEIGDDEAVVRQGNPPAASEPEKPRYQKPAIGGMGMLAVRWCKDPEFQAWVAQQTHGGAFDAMDRAPEAECKEFILKKCGVTSRKYLDTDPIAHDLFQEDIRGPYMKHLTARGILR
jgi:hypothetical protein